MSISNAAGKSSYSGNFIPELWSSRLLRKFYAGTCLAEICNTEYEGEIKKFGDKVIIRQIPTLAIKDYVKGQTLDFQTPRADPVTLTIDYAKYFAFVVDKVDLKQMDIPAIEKWSEDAAEQMKIEIERAVFAAVYASAHASNKGATAGAITAGLNMGAAGSPLSVTKSSILDLIVDAGTVLDDQNVPENDRWMILPAWACGMIKKSDLRNASISGDDTNKVLRNGRLGMIDRFTLYSSNLLATGTDTTKVFNAMFGSKTALSFATQLTDADQHPNPTGFGTLAKGLQVYGYKVLKPEALGHLYITKG